MSPDTGIGLPPRAAARLAGLQLAARLLPSDPSSREGLPKQARILLVRPDHLGDLLLSLPAVSGLQRAWPAASISVLCGPWAADVLRGHPAVDAILTCSFPGFDRRPRAARSNPYRLLLVEAARLRRQRFDAAAILRPDAWWAALLCRLAGIPRRYGFDVPEAAPFMSDVLPADTTEHVTSESRRLLSALAGRRLPLGDGRVFPSLADRRRATEIVSQSRRPRVVAIHAGSGSPVKRWDDAATVRLADSMSERLGAEVLFIAGLGEVGLAERLAAWCRQPARVVTGLGLLELAALLARCELVFGPDSGVLHLASAAGARTVRLYGPAAARRFGPAPGAPPAAVIASRLDCAPCGRLDFTVADLPYHRCVLDISYERVLGVTLATAGALA